MKNAKKKYSVSPTKLTQSVPKSWLPFKTTADLPQYEGMIGQDRAMRAVDVGLRVDTRGFNIYAAGETGSGKTSTLERILKARAEDDELPKDLCYVYNFRAPDQPRPLFLPAGNGRNLASDMEKLVKELERLAPRVLTDGTFGHIRAGILVDTRKKAEELVRKASKEAEKLDLIIQEEEDNLRVLPMMDGKPLEQEAFESLSNSKRHAIENNILAFQKHMDEFSYERRQLERSHVERLREAEVRALTPIVDELLGELLERYKEFGGPVSEFLREVKDHILQNHTAFSSGDDSAGGNQTSPEQILMEMQESDGIDPHTVYQVNVVVDRSDQKGAPVVVERVPTVSNLAGYFEYRETQGGLVTDHTMIRAGAMHRANGGYLLLQAADVLSHEHAWETLKRSLRHKEIRIEEGSGSNDGRPRIAGMLKPGTTPLQLKVILVGSQEVYYFLKIEDEEFSRLFKIKADFGPSMERSREGVLKLAQFLGQVCREEDYLPLHQSGVARLIEYASRKSGHKRRMTTRRGALLDVIAEANLYAREARARSIRDQDVERAIAEERERHASLGDAIYRQISEGSIIIATEGGAVGQLNGIALYDLAGKSFGIPVRITARTYAGRRGVVNIDREVQLSGAVHDKGALILVGYLGGRYAQEQTLGLSASITFEQSYDEIDGDSASSAELFALLSALAQVPIKQGIAVTGSVNQLGEIQPIGGVNEKIEGVFRVCKERGLTGAEGVVIPQANVKNLMLDAEVIDAVKAGDFHIYAVSTIDEGIEVLTGLSAGTLRADGTWTPGSINALVAEKLASLLGVVASERGVQTALDLEL